MSLVAELEADTVHVFWPIERNREIDTRPLIRSLADAGRMVVLPSEAASTPHSIVQRRYVEDASLVENRWGALEPSSGALVELRETDLIITPALAVDRRGYRVGYGGGYYDRFLAEADCPAAAIVYSGCLYSELPHETHDVKVGRVITELDTIVT